MKLTCRLQLRSRTPGPSFPNRHIAWVRDRPGRRSPWTAAVPFDGLRHRFWPGVPPPPPAPAALLGTAVGAEQQTTPGFRTLRCRGSSSCGVRCAGRRRRQARVRHLGAYLKSLPALPIFSHRKGSADGTPVGASDEHRAYSDPVGGHDCSVHGRRLSDRRRSRCDHRAVHCCRDESDLLLECRQTGAVDAWRARG